MFSGVYQSLLLLLFVLVFYTADSLLIRRYDRLRAYGSSRSWSYTALAVVAALFLIVQPVLLPGLGLRVAAWWGIVLQVLGLLLLAGGLALHWWARTHLGQFYGEREELQPGQHLVQEGPYAYVRHPLYTSYFILSGGMLLVNPSLPMLLVLAYALVDFSLATRREEKLLVESLPGYADYMARTPRFFPRLAALFRR